jgi:hypothetical protein
MKDYPERRYKEQIADGVTIETVEYIKNESRIKALITGHLHINYECLLNDRLPQIITGCTDLRLIEFI